MSILQHASKEDAKSVYAVITKYKDIFPHVRYDAICRRIEKSQCIWDSGVVITYTLYKRKVEVGVSPEQKRIFANKGDVMIHQIAASDQGNGEAKRIVNTFINDLHKSRRVWLTVRQDNKRAVNFYDKKIGMDQVGEVYWMSGTLAGYVFCYDGTTTLYDN